MRRPTLEEIKEQYGLYLLLTRKKGMCFISKDDYNELTCYNIANLNTHSTQGLMNVEEPFYENNIDSNKGYDVIAVKKCNAEIEPIMYVHRDIDSDEIEWDWEDVEEMTLSEVCKALGKNIKIVKE